MVNPLCIKHAIYETDLECTICKYEKNKIHHSLINNVDDKEKYKKLYRTLDTLLAEFFKQNDSLLGLNTPVKDLMKWVYDQVKKECV